MRIIPKIVAVAVVVVNDAFTGFFLSFVLCTSVLRI
jgi:hypothetical protein